MAVPPTSPAKEGNTGGKRKRPLSPASESKPSGRRARAAGEAPPPVPKRAKSPGVRLVGGRIYDSEHGKSCHQCRQKTMDFAAACKDVRRGKPCPIRFCHKCLLNRYGEKAEEVAAREDWSCPKCRGICNCSFCMKKNGHRPTGILVHTAKATGYSSVSEMLQLYHMRHEANKETKNSDVMTDNPPSSDKQLVLPERKLGKENDACAPNRVLDNTKGQASKPSKQKVVTLDVGVKEMRKTSKIKREKSNAIACASTTCNIAKKENLLAKKMRGENLGKSAKKDDGMHKRKVASKGHNEKKLSTSEGKNELGNFNEEAQACLGNDVDKRKGDFGEDVSREVKSPVKKKQMDIRNVLSVCNKKEMSIDETGNSTKSELLLRVCKKKKQVLMCVGHSPNSVSVMPQGKLLTTIAGIELQAEDVGPALQFLEFCSAFRKVLDIKKGQPESVLRELEAGRGKRRGVNSILVQFYIKLLSRIENDKGERFLSCSTNHGSWLKALNKCITESKCALGDLPVHWLNKGESGYASLDSSKKLRLLNFLCDALLDTEELRSWIDQENMNFTEKQREYREKVLAAKEEEKCLKKKLKDEVAEAMLQLRNGAPLTVSEHQDLVSKIMTQTEKAHAEVLGSLGTLRNRKQRSDAVRTEPILLERDGLAYWRLSGYNSSCIVLQDVGNLGSITPQDKWFVYDDEQEKLVEKHVYSSRNKRLSRHWKPRIPRSYEDHAEHGPPKDSTCL